MPRLFDLNLVALLVASIAFYLVGFLWYGVMFMNAWMGAHGVTADNGSGGIWMAGGFVITVVQVVGIGKVLQWRNVVSVPGAALTGLFLWALFAFPILHYAYIYLPAHSHTLLLIDGSHLLVGWVLSAVILRLIK